MGRTTLPFAPAPSTRQPAAARGPGRSVLRKIGGGFKSVGRVVKKGVTSKIGRIVTPILGAIAIPGLGGFLGKGLTTGLKIAGKGFLKTGGLIKRGAVAAHKRGYVEQALSGFFAPSGAEAAVADIAGVEAAIQKAERAGAAAGSGGLALGAKWHDTAGLIPVEIREVIDDLAPNEAAVAFVASSFGAQVKGAKKNRIFFPQLGAEFKLVWHMGDPDGSASWGWDQVIDGSGGVGAIEADTYGGPEPTPVPDIPYEWVIWLYEDPGVQPWLDAIAVDVFGSELATLPEENQKIVVMALLMEA